MFVQMPGFLGLRAEVDDGTESAPYVAPPVASPDALPLETGPAIAVGETTNGRWARIANNDEVGSFSDVFVPYGTPIFGWVDTTPNAEHSTIEYQVINANTGPDPLPVGVGSDWAKVQPPAVEYEWGSAPAPAPVYVAPWSQVDDVSQIAPTLPRAVDVIQNLSPPPAVAPVAQIPSPAPSPAPQPIPVVNSGGGNVTMPGQFLPNQTVPRQTALPAVDDYGSADGAPTLPGQSQASGGFGMLLAVAGLLLSNS